MLIAFTHLWEKMLNIGNDYLISRAHIALGRIYNIILFILTLCSLVSLINEVAQGHFYGTINNVVICLAVFTVVYLKYRGELWKSAFLLNIMLPLSISTLAIFYTNVKFLPFYFCAFIISGALYSQEQWIKYFFVAYNTVCLCFIYWYQSNYGSVINNAFHDKSNIVVFINFALFFLILIFQIINKLIVAGAEIEALNQQLLDKNQNLNKEKEELQKFVYHDLKAPLNTISNFTGLIEKEVKKYNNSKLNQYCHFVIDGTKKMDKLINESLLLAQDSDLENLQPQSINLQQLIEEIEIDLSSKYDNFIIQKNNLPTIQGHHTIYKKIFQNLIQNGLKYNTSEQKIITISHKKKNGLFVYFVEDNGIGIPEHQYKSIFEKYNRGNHQNNFEGTGLGLAITQQMLANLNGKIKVMSTQNKGSIFTITLPPTNYIPVLNTGQQRSSFYDVNPLPN